MNPTTTIAIRAARKAGSLVMRYYHRIDTLHIRQKTVYDYVSEVDHLAEQSIINTLRQAYPSHAILAEESGSQGQDSYEWIIDPLDGTNNYLHGLPHFAISIALRHQGKLQLGVIYDPLHNDLFVSNRGSGALLNDRRLRMTHTQRLAGALIGSAIGRRSAEANNLEQTLQTGLMNQGVSLRRSGSSVLDLAYVAAGYLDGTWQQGLQTWDMAAGILMVQEAGGMVTDFSGRGRALETGNVVAGNRLIHMAILKHLKPAKKSQPLHLNRR